MSDRGDTNTETWSHIHDVRCLLTQVVESVLRRCLSHDQTKLRDPELATFVEFTPRLKGSTYGSDEYKGFLASMKPALDHHYANNRHHPEHFDAGVSGMTLVDLIEMLADWKAATMRHDDGDIMRSIEINRGRFGLDDQIAYVLRNTVKSFGWASYQRSDQVVSQIEED